MRFRSELENQQKWKPYSLVNRKIKGLNDELPQAGRQPAVVEHYFAAQRAMQEVREQQFPPMITNVGDELPYIKMGGPEAAR